MDNRYSGYINIYISDDEMAADIFLVEAPSPDFYKLEEILEYIQEQGITYGIKEEVLKDIVENKRYGEFIHFVEGAVPEEGINGSFDFKFDTNPSKKPKLKSDGSVDYYNLNLVETVQKDQIVAEYIPKKDGKEGVTIKGNIIPATKGKDMPPLRGKGFYTSEDNIYYYAEYDGKVELIMGRLTVSAMHTVMGNVDLSTGNIDFRGDLMITGNISSDMKVKATGNITVDGLIEAASVEAGKAILVKGGILGGGKSVIKAGTDVYAQFIENTFVESNGCVQADSIINSNINAYNDINVFGRTSCIIGGKLKANRYIRTKIIGSDKGVTTIMEVGVPNDCYSERKRCAEKLQKFQQDLEKTELLLEKMASSGEENGDMAIQVTRTKIELTAEIFRMRAILKELDLRLEIGRNAEIIAEKMVYPGVHVIIDGIHYEVPEEYQNISFFRKGDKIVSKKPDELFDISKMSNNAI